MKKIGNLKTRASNEIEKSGISIGFECLDRELFKPEPCYDLLQKTGVKYARCQTGWARCERERGVYCFSWLDTAVDNLRARGIEVWFNVGYGNPLYMENIPNKTGVGCVPLFFGDACLTAWKNYVSALAAHFAGRVRLFEIWNEPEADHFWYPEAPDPEKYAALFRITTEQIRKHVPEAKFAATVASGFDFGYIRGMLAAMQGMQMDFFAFHAHSKYPEISFGHGRPYLDNVKHLRSLLDAAGFEKTELIQGEAGQPSWAPKGHWLYKDGFDDPRAQAVWLLRRFALDHYAGVSVTSFFMIADIWEKPYETATQILPRAQANGILNGLVYTPKPSYEALCHTAGAFCGDVKKTEAYFTVEGALDDPCETAATVRLCFEKNGEPMYLYYLPSAPTEKCYREGAVSVYLSQPLRDGVLADLLSGEVFDLPKAEDICGLAAYRSLPLTNYPMLLTERSAIFMEEK